MSKAARRVYPPIQIGDRFGKLTVEGPGEKQGRRNTIRCRCVCGKVRDFVPGKLNAGQIVSCFNCSDSLGLSKTPEYQAWYGMIHRCHDPQDRFYPEYGGRGITVCELWKGSFAAFLSDMGPRPSEDHSLDRIDVGGNYAPGNCRWASRQEQARNKRTTVYLDTPDGRVPLAAVAEHCGLSYHALYQRIFIRGWPLERAMKTRNLRARRVPVD